MAPGSARGRTGSSATPLRVCCAPSPSAALLFLVQWRVKRRSGGKRAQWARANRRASSPAVKKGGQRVLFAPRPALLPSRGGAMGSSHQKVPRTGRDRRGGAGGAPGAVRGRGRVRICCKGAPGRDRPREEARNINDSLPVLRRDPGLCNRFRQPVPPRIPGRGAAGRTETTAGAPGAETCTSHSRVQFQPLFSKAKRTSRGQNAHLDEEGAGRGHRGPRRRSRPGASPVRETHCDS